MRCASLARECVPCFVYTTPCLPGSTLCFVAGQAGRYKDGILHSMKVLELDASDPLHQVRQQTHN
jgi:hypothetical protein